MHTANPPKRRLNAIGPALRRVRCERNWSQQALAAKCQLLGWDIDRFTITRIEAGSRWVGDTELVTLCRVLQVAPSDLLPVVPPPSFVALHHANTQLAP